MPRDACGMDHGGRATWWVKDAQGIPLCKVCDACESARLARYRPEILSGYDASDVNEPIEGDEW